MSQVIEIQSVHAREVLDSRGFPTVEVELGAKGPKGQFLSRAIVPSGASTGEGEALELRDGDKNRYLGKGVTRAVDNVNNRISPSLMNREFARQTLLDDLLRDLDGTSNKSELGANAILGVSMAFARAQALCHDIPLYQSIAQIFESSGHTLPTPMMNILNGGAHADNGLDIQEFMIVPIGAPTFKEALRAGSEVFHNLKKILVSKRLSTGVGDEGGFAPRFESMQPHEQALMDIQQAITNAGYKPGKDICLALDMAASEFVDKARAGDEEMIYQFEGKRVPASALAETLSRWVERYHIISIEDALSEHDWKGWKELTKKLGSGCQLVGDDIFVTNPSVLKRGIDEGVANSILIKLNQIGTLTETLETMKLAGQNHYSTVTSHRSGETEDTFIADLAVGTDSGQIKTGSLCRTDRIAKYNQLLRIEERLGSSAKYAGRSAFRHLK